MIREDYTDRMIFEIGEEKDFTLNYSNENSRFQTFIFKDLGISKLTELEDSDEIKIEFVTTSASKKEENNSRIKEFIPLYKSIGKIGDLRKDKTKIIELEELSNEYPTANVEQIIIFDERKKIKGYTGKIIFTKTNIEHNSFMGVVYENLENELFKLDMPNNNISDYDIPIVLYVDLSIRKDFNSFLKPVIFKAAFDRILMTLMSLEDDEIEEYKELVNWILKNIPIEFDGYMEKEKKLSAIPSHERNRFIDLFSKSKFKLPDLYEKLISNERSKYAR